MKYTIVYESRTGNTKELAEVIKEELKGECLYMGKPSEDIDIESPDVIFIGSWTDKGTFDEKINQILKHLENKKIFLFGTAGFESSKDYHDTILENVKKNISSSNVIIGEYMCQGKMPLAIRNKYENMDQKDVSFNIEEFIANFDKATSHPDSNDIDDLRKCIRGLKEIG